MNCPDCGAKAGVFKTRAQPDGSVLRERRCRARGCRAQFVTIEQVRRALGERIGPARPPKR